MFHGEDHSKKVMMYFFSFKTTYFFPKSWVVFFPPQLKQNQAAKHDLASCAAGSFHFAGAEATYVSPGIGQFTWRIEQGVPGARNLTGAATWVASLVGTTQRQFVFFWINSKTEMKPSPTRALCMLWTVVLEHPPAVRKRLETFKYAEGGPDCEAPEAVWNTSSYICM